MNKNIFSFGLILLIVGLLVVAISAMNVKKEGQNQVALVENGWTASCNLQVGDDIFVVVRPGARWGDVFEGGDYELPVNVSVVAPDEGEALFQLMYKQWPEPPQWPEAPWPTYASRIVLVKADEDSLATKEPVYEVGGIVGRNGTYTVRVTMDWSEEPPTEISFQKRVVEYERPYTAYIPVGGAMSVFGIAVSIYNMRSKRRRLLRKAK